MTALPCDELAVGGNFSTAGSHVSAYFARFASAPNPCPPDFDCSATINPDDIFAFLSAWFALDPAADINNDSAISVPDIFSFLSA